MPQAHGKRAALYGVSAAAVALLAFVVYQLGQVLLLFSAAVLFAIFLDGLARWLSARVPLGRLPCLAIIGGALVTSGFFLFWFAGPRVSRQLVELVESVKQAIKTLATQLRDNDLGRRLLEAIPEDPVAFIGDEAFETAAGLAERLLSGASGAALVVVVGTYLALTPELYRNAVIKLLPIQHRPRGREVASSLAHVLRRWLVGRAASMGVVGVLTWLGLALLGVPVAMSLAIVATFLSFVPFLGPLLSYVPAVLIAVADSGAIMGIWITMLYAGVQALETSIITPQIEKMAVSLPPAFLITAQLGFAGLAGTAGIIMATPLTVVVVVLIQMLYIEGMLGDEVTVLAADK